MPRRQHPRLSAELRLEAALVNYQAKLAALRAVQQCTSWWPPDLGTRCDLLEGHGGDHRHKPKGMSVGVITWQD